jgi:hypothetical protein
MKINFRVLLTVLLCFYTRRKSFAEREACMREEVNAFRVSVVNFEEKKL